MSRNVLIVAILSVLLQCSKSSASMNELLLLLGDKQGNIPAPTRQLQYKILAGPTLAMRGATITIPISILSSGADQPVQVWFSANATITSLDTFITGSVISKTSSSITATIPASLPLATYYVGVCPNDTSACTTNDGIFVYGTLQVVNPQMTCTTAPCSVRIQWAVNREKGVNSSGGGYAVCTGPNSTFTRATATKCDQVTYSSGSTTPTSVDLQFQAGSWFVKVYAYSSLNPTGSESSIPFAVAVP